MPACLSEDVEGCKRTEMPSTGDDAVEGYFLDSVSANAPDALCGRLAAFVALLLAEEADFTFSVFSTAASETTFKPIPRSVSPPGWKHFSMQIPAPTGWHSA